MAADILHDVTRKDLSRALALLGPLEARIMRLVWHGRIRQPFVVWDVQARMPELAYTTVMTTVARLAEKGLLTAERVPNQRSVLYHAAGSPTDFLARASQQRVEELVRLLGDAALAAFEVQLGKLSEDQRRRLRDMAGR